MQIKTAMINHLISITMSTIKKLENSKCWSGCGIIRTLVHCWWDYNMVQTLWKTVWQFLKKLKVELLCNQEILLQVYTQEFKLGSQKDIWTLMFIAALFKIAKRWIQPNFHWQMNDYARSGNYNKEMAIHSSMFAWKIPWTEEPDGL